MVACSMSSKPTESQGLLRLEPARQLGVGARLLETVRPRLHRLSDPRTRAEGELLLVSRLHRKPTDLSPALACRPGQLRLELGRLVPAFHLDGPAGRVPKSAARMTASCPP